jgi:hypothetical protein
VTLILVGDSGGLLIGELAAEVESVAWKLNEPGRARLTLANPGTASALIQFGNRILIYFDNGLPPWAGFVDPPRRWRYGSLTLDVHGGEALLAQRVTNRGRFFTGSTVGAMMAALLKEQSSPAVLEAGHIYTGGGAYTVDYHYEDLLDVVNDLLDLEDFDYDVTGTLENGRIVLRFNLYARKGYDLQHCYLLEGHNVSAVEPEEQGPIINEWLIAGGGTGWTDSSRPYAQAQDAGSIAAYSRRQGGEVLSDARHQATLDGRAELNLSLSKDPYAAISLDAANLAPAAFADYHVGDRVNVELYSYLDGGFSGQRRVIGREWRPGAGAARTVLI